MEKNRDEDKGGVKDAITCFICMTKIKEPLMCKYCQKLACKQCLIEYFQKNDNTKCLNCGKETSMVQMIPVPFMDYLTDFYIQNMKNNNQSEILESKQNIKKNIVIEGDDDEDEEETFDNKEPNLNLFSEKNKTKNKDKFLKEKCSKHKNNDIEYYCVQCAKKYCDKCLVCTSEESKKHTNHNILPITSLKNYHFDEINKELDYLKHIKIKVDNYNSQIKYYKKYNLTKKNIYNSIIEKYTTDYRSELTKRFNEINIEKEIIQLEKITNIVETSDTTVEKLIEREDYKGSEDYLNILKKMENNSSKIINNLDKDQNNYKLNFNPILNIYETEYFNFPINLENIVTLSEEIYIEQIDKKFNLVLTNENNLVFVDLGIPSDKKYNYNIYLLLKGENGLVTFFSADFIRKDNDYLELGNNLNKNGFFQYVNKNNEICFKFFIGQFSF